MIIDLDFAPVDNYIPQGDMFRYRPLRNVIFIYITKTRLIKYIDNFSTKKKLKNFRQKKFDIFLISAQNIDCGYLLEPPLRSGSNEYPQSMF